jgi:hypothetical protein
VNVAAVGDQAIATYDALNNTLVIDINPGITRAATVVSAINSTGTFTAQLDDKLDGDNDGSGFVDFTASATTSGGSGENFDAASGLQIVNGGTTHLVEFSSAQTVEDLLNILNGADAKVLATINESGNGINIRSRVSGTDFMIGENGGTTATQLGLRSLTDHTLLAELNYGRGVDLNDSIDSPSSAGTA